MHPSPLARQVEVSLEQASKAGGRARRQCAERGAGANRRAAGLGSCRHNWKARRRVCEDKMGGAVCVRSVCEDRSTVGREK